MLEFKISMTSMIEKLKKKKKMESFARKLVSLKK